MKKQTIFNLSKKGVLFSYVENNELIISDATNIFTEPCNMDDGLIEIINEETFPIDGKIESLDIPGISKKAVKMEFNTKILVELQAITGSDDLNPILQHIHVNKERQVLEATDANILRQVPYKAKAEGLMLIDKFVLPMIKQVEIVTVYFDYDQNVILYDFGECKLYQKLNLDVKYPDFESVIPEYSDAETFNLPPLKEMVKYKVDGCYLNEKFHLIDDNINKTWDCQKAQLPNSPVDGIIMPVFNNSEGSRKTAFSIKKFKTLVGAKHGVMAVINNNSAIGVWFTEPIKTNTTKPKHKSVKINPVNLGPDVVIKNYSERAIVVIGNTKPIKDELKAIGGRYNRFLRDEMGERFNGWVFPKKRIEEVKETIKIQ